MTCAEFQELAGAWAAGALEPPERAEMEAHLTAGEHQGCSELRQRMEQASHLLALSLPPVKPAPRVWDEIARATAGARPFEIGRALGWGVAAALAAALAVVLLQPRGDPERERTLLAAERERCAGQLQARAADRELEHRLLEMLDSPTSHLVALQPQNGQPGRATAVLDLSARKAMVLSGALPAESGKDYELWVISGKTASPAGLVHQLDSGLAIGDFNPARLMGSVDALAISLEPAGGSPQPTRVLLVGPVKG